MVEYITINGTNLKSTRIGLGTWGRAGGRGEEQTKRRHALRNFVGDRRPTAKTNRNQRHAWGPSGSLWNPGEAMFGKPSLELSRASHCNYGVL
jgi:hypothetical protein